MKLKELLQELIDKNVSLEKSANILWQWKIYEAAKEEERYGKVRDASPDAQEHLHRVAEAHRLQLEHYLVVANISDELVSAIVRPDKVKPKVKLRVKSEEWRRFFFNNS